MDWLITLLNLFGITPDKYPFLVLGLLIIAVAGYIRFSIGGTMGRMKDNILVIITYLSTNAPNRGKLDTSLIKMMSPMRITPQGHEVLVDSGFMAVFNTPRYKAQYMSYLRSQNPRTKLDVESLAIVSFATFLEKDFMNPIKTYLFNNPAVRETYQTLAGLYIRDEYFKDHPEIIE